MVLMTAPKRKLTGRIEAKSISKNQVAQVIKREHQPCWCGRSTYRLSALEPEVCSGCNQPVGACDCKPYNPRNEILRG